MAVTKKSVKKVLDSDDSLVETEGISKKKVVAKKTVSKKKAESKTSTPVKKTSVKKSKIDTPKEAIVLESIPEEYIPDNIDIVRELPIRYNETKISLIMRDPDWCYFYWDISDADSISHNIVSKQLKVKIFRINDIDLSAHKEHVEVSVGNIFGDYYINLHNPNAYFIAELGYYEDGIFKVIVRSNITYSPRDSISTVYDDEWMINEDIVKTLSTQRSFRVSLSSASIMELLDSESYVGGSISLLKKRDIN